MNVSYVWYRRIAAALAVMMLFSVISAFASVGAVFAEDEASLGETPSTEESVSEAPVSDEAQQSENAAEINGAETPSAEAPAADGETGNEALPDAPLSTPEKSNPEEEIFERMRAEAGDTLPEKGLRFERSQNEWAVTESALPALPDTTEIRIKLDPGVNSRQIIMNNYQNGTEKSWGLEVTADNTLRYWESMGNGGAISCLFSSGENKIDICTGEWMLISVVRDKASKKVLAYVNGELAGTMNAGYNFSDDATTHPLHFGTDLRKGMFLSGEIGEVRMWSNARSAEEIRAYAGRLVTGAEDGLVHAWNFSEADGDVNSETVFEDMGTGALRVKAAGFPKFLPPETDIDFGELTGVSFDDSADQLCSVDRLSDIPRSFEATIRLPKDLAAGVRGGIICGNYMNAGYYNYDLGYVNFEVYAGGKPRLYWLQQRRNQPNSGEQSVVIDSVDLRRDKWIHLAMTFDDAADTVKCYVNGVLVAVVENCAFSPVVPAQALKIGGDYRGAGGTTETKGYNEEYFKGEIANVSIWSSVRSAEEIAADAAALKDNGDVPSGAQSDLLSSWSFAASEASSFEDLSGNNNDVRAFTDWIDPDFAEGDYSMIALPDTQFLSEYYPELYKNLTQWIADNKDRYNIQAVIHLGDMVDDSTVAQWLACKDAMDTLNGTGIPWMPMRGNHDPSDGFNAAFPYAQYGANRSWFGGSYEHEKLGQDKLDSHYWNITVGDREYLILSLGWSPSQDAVDWAAKIVEENPDKNVILTAHAFMYWDGTHLNDEDLDYAPMYGTAIWDAIGSKYPNVVLAMGGHIGFPDIVARADKNGAGKDVSSLLCDAQGIDFDYGLAMMTMLTFHEGSDTVDVNWYSVDESKLFRERNQFSVTVPHVTPEAPEEQTVPADYDGYSAVAGSASAEKGEAVEYGFYADADANAISILDIEFVYDSEKLRFDSAAAEAGFGLSFVDGKNKSDEQEAGVLTVVLAKNDGSGVSAQDLTKLLSLRFTAIASGEAAVTVRSIGAGGYTASDEAVNLKIALPKEPAKTLISEYHVYDFNRDGKVDYGDIAALQRHYGKTDESADWGDIARMDITGDDGIIDVADLMLILVFVRVNG